MTAFSLAMGVFRLALLVVPFCAIMFTAQDELNAYTLLCIWVPQFLKSTGWNVIEHYWGWEIDLYFTLIMASKTAYSVVQTWDAVWWWGSVLLVEGAFVAAKFTRLKLYLDEWRFSEQDALQLNAKRNAPGTWNPLAKTKEQRERDTMDPVSLFNIILLTLTVTIFNAARVAFLYVDSYDNGQPPWGTLQETPSNLAAWMTIVEAGIVVVLCIRSTSQYSVNQSNFTISFAGIYFLYIYLTLAQLWIVDPVIRGIVVGQAICTTLVLWRVMHQTMKIPGGYTNTALIGFKELVVTLWQAISSEPVIQLCYTLLVGVSMFCINDSWYKSSALFSADVRSLTCIPLEVVDEYVSKFVEVTTNPKWQRLITVIATEISRLRLQLLALIGRIYPSLKLACRGPEVEMIPSNDWILVCIIALSWLPALFIIAQPFIEAQRVIRQSKYWAVTATLALIALIASHVTGDAKVTLWWVIIQSTYQRQYSSIGMSMLLAQIVMILMATLAWYNRLARDNTRKQLHQAKTSGPIDTVVGLVSQVKEWIFKPGFLLLAITIAYAGYSLTQNSFIDKVDIVPIEDNDTPSWAHVSSLDRFETAVASIAIMLGNHVRAVLTLVAVAEVVNDEIGNPCVWFVEKVCLSDIISGIGNVIELLIKGAFNAAEWVILRTLDEIPGKVITPSTRIVHCRSSLLDQVLTVFLCVICSPLKTSPIFWRISLICSRSRTFNCSNCLVSARRSFVYHPGFHGWRVPSL